MSGTIVTLLRPLVRKLRPKCDVIGDCLSFRPLPLFVVVAQLLDEERVGEELVTCGRHRGRRLVDLDPGDPDDQDIIEPALLDMARDVVQLEEVLVVELYDRPDAFEVSLCLAHVHQDDALLVIHAPEVTPSFLALGVGRPVDLLHAVGAHHDLFLQVIGVPEEAEITRVMVRGATPMSIDTIASLVEAMTALRCTSWPIING